MERHVEIQNKKYTGRISNVKVPEIKTPPQKISYDIMH